MARKEIFVSDLSGQEITNGDAALIQITLTSKPRSTFSLDVREDEIANLLAVATETAKRGRKPKVAA